MRHVLWVFLLTVTVGHAADQAILGNQLLVKNPSTPDKRKIVGKAKEIASANTLVGDPVTNGATLIIRAEGGTSTEQTFFLQQGTSVTGKPFWSGDAVKGFKYNDSKGDQSPVKAAQIKKSASGVFGIKLKVEGKLGTVDVLPPDPGTGGCVLLNLIGGDAYSVRFAPGDGQVQNKDGLLFKVKKPSTEGIFCAHDLCTSGGPLSPACDPCVQDICDEDPFCCFGQWDSICQEEVGEICGTPCPGCGNGIVEGSETCDGLAGCPAGETCDGTCSTCVVVCGDGVVGGGETCEFDGNVGCTAGSYCNGSCSGCDTFCGDNITAGTEVCDGSTGCPGAQLCNGTCSACNACPTATVIPAEGGTFPGATSPGGSFVLGSCGGSASSPERTFEWTPAASGSATIALCGSSYDTVLYIREGGCSGAQLACNDDFCGLSSTITPTVTAGQTYTIVVDGFSGSSGSFVLTVTPPGGSPSGAFLDADG